MSITLEQQTTLPITDRLTQENQQLLQDIDRQIKNIQWLYSIAPLEDLDIACAINTQIQQIITIITPKVGHNNALIRLKILNDIYDTIFSIRGMSRKHNFSKNYAQKHQLTKKDIHYHFWTHCSTNNI